MEKIEMLRCMTVDDMVKTVSNLSNIDTALDIINKGKYNEKIELEWIGDKLRLKTNKTKLKNKYINK